MQVARREPSASTSATLATVTTSSLVRRAGLGRRRVRWAAASSYVLSCALSASGAFGAEVAKTEPIDVEGEPESEPASEPVRQGAESRFSVGVRGFGGVRAESGEVRALGGGSLLFAIGLARHWELEAGAAFAAIHESSPLSVFELMGKWVVEPEEKFSPHLTLGPAASLDVDSSVAFSMGAIAGIGASYWFAPRLGWVSDLNYRILFGREVSNVVTFASGLTWKL